MTVHAYNLIMNQLATLLTLSILAAVGAMTRYGLDLAFVSQNHSLPVSTLIINAAGSLLAGVLYSVFTHSALIPLTLQTGLMVGLLGGFTTFSAFSLQNLKLLEEGRLFTALCYLLGSPLLGLSCAAVGAILTRKFLI